MVLTTPLLARLAESGPVDVVATPAASPLLANHPAVRRTMVYDKRATDSGITGFARLARQLRAGEYDRAYLAQGSIRSGALALVAGIGSRVGFDSSAGRRLYTERVPYIESDHHASRLLSLAGGQIALKPELHRPRLYPGAAEVKAVDDLLAGADHSGRLYALAPGSVWATKRWPGFPALAAELARSATVVIIGSAGDSGIAATISQTAGPSIIDATGRLSLLASAELIRRARLLVTNDSAPLHLASAMNTPTVAVFGPTVPAFGFGPLAERSRTIGIDALACRPCDRHGPNSCPLRHWNCMREVSVDQVLGAVEYLTG
jgi:heptosyltransferase-2